TSTGRTLADNGLKIVDDGVVMRSEAALAASLAATWGPGARDAARLMLTRIAADARARAVKRIEAAIEPTPDLRAAARDRFGAEAPFSGGSLVLVCPARSVHACAAWLIEAGAAAVTVQPVEYVFEAANPLYDTLARRLDG
ncbi:MAG TPA: ATP phosphoribosyltransferase, partial [Methylomirabilota bacterium]|nr:ATP phosphoribosyltransferase [Methylomirabilota bacterium]